MAEQLAFPLPRLDARGRDAFFVSPANALAVRLIEGWRDWPQGKLVLSGPEGSGKTHLAHVWAALSGAGIITAGGLAGADIPALADGPVTVEDVDRIAGQAEAETALFHLHNLMQANHQPLLLSARRPAAHWRLSLPDLQSRVSAAATAALEPPDDALLSAVIVKLFADRQIVPPARLLDYCLRRMNRSFAAAQDLVATLDARALATGQPIGVALAAGLFEKS